MSAFASARPRACVRKSSPSGMAMPRSSARVTDPFRVVFLGQKAQDRSTQFPGVGMVVRGQVEERTPGYRAVLQAYCMKWLCARWRCLDTCSG